MKDTNPTADFLPEGGGKNSLANPQRTLVMAVLNITPDSFSDGGRWDNTKAALERVDYLLQQGADLIDVGGESTRPGSQRITAAEEMARILPVVKELVSNGTVVSVDTVHASTAAACVEAGVSVINDVSGACFDPQMKTVMAQSQALCVIQHWRGFPGTDSERLLTTNVVPTLVAELNHQVQQVLESGVDPAQIIVDPGFGFAKDVQASWEILQSLTQICSQVPYPLLVGTSRKRMIKDLGLKISGTTEMAPVRADELTAATSVIAAQAGAWAVRVHEPAASRAAVEVVNRLQS